MFDLSCQCFNCLLFKQTLDAMLNTTSISSIRSTLNVSIKQTIDDAPKVWEELFHRKLIGYPHGGNNQRCDFG